MQKTLQYEESELLGHSFFDILSFDSREQLARLLGGKLAEHADSITARRARRVAEAERAEEVRRAWHWPRERGCEAEV